MIAVGLLAALLGAGAPAATRDAPVFTLKRDGHGSAVVGREWQLSACRDRWSLEELKEDFRFRAMHLCREGVHLGRFVVEDDVASDHEAHRECRTRRISAEINCRRVQP